MQCVILQLAKLGLFGDSPFSQARELQHWQEAPEEFHHQSDSAAYRDNIRPCAELLFATLLQVQ